MTHKILDHDAFWHESLHNGGFTQKISQGIVETFWYLPVGQENDEFKTPVIFANLRGNSNQHPILSDSLRKISTTTCIFIHEIKKEDFTVLKYFSEASLKKVILLILYESGKNQNAVKICTDLRKSLELDDYQVIKFPLNDRSLCTTKINLQRLLKRSFEVNVGSQSSFRKFVENKVISAESAGQIAAEEILQAIDEIDSDYAKTEILSHESDLNTRINISKHDKEICRLNNVAGEELIQQCLVKEKDQKWQLQWKQLQYPMSDIFTRFLQSITNLNFKELKYFLKSLKLGLKERSVEIIQPLLEKYEKICDEACREMHKKTSVTENLIDYRDEREGTLMEIDKQLILSSFGLEHFFREIAIVYENMVALNEKVGVNSLNGVLETLSATMAGILQMGEVLEIFDGDSGHSHIIWLSAVLNRIENRGRIFKISVLGAQTCGKFMLLNSLFGLNLPVRSGRRTRGACLQLVKIEKQLAERFNCDSLLVIDSEGLMSRISNDYDKELATFVIGISDITLVVTNGNENEMQDVLSIAIHVLLRMKVLEEQQKFHFVHQNSEKSIASDTFRKLLDEKIEIAAAEAGVENCQRLTDIMQYHSTSVLVNGKSSMLIPGIEYTTAVQTLKNNIFERLATKGCSTFGHFSKKLEDNWKAIKFENCVFNFRNVETVESYKRLTGIINVKEWEIKKTMRDNMESVKMEIEDDLLLQAGTDNEKLNSTIHERMKKAKEDTRGFINSSSKSLSFKILHFFNCSGCPSEDCSKEVRNRELLRGYKSKFMHDIEQFRKDLEVEVNQSIENLEAELTNACSAQSDETGGIIKTIYPKPSHTDIKVTVQRAIRMVLAFDNFMYNKKICSSIEFNKKDFHVKKSYLRSPRVSPIGFLKSRTDTIIEETSVHYNIVEEGKRFEPKHAEILFKDIHNRIDLLRDETTLEYKIDLMMHIESLAVKNFIVN